VVAGDGLSQSTGVRIRQCRTCDRGWRFEKLYGIPRQKVWAFGNPKPCEMCGASEHIRLDHCHVTLELRGWLCRSCNVAIAMFRENTESLQNAIFYLKVHWGEGKEIKNIDRVFEEIAA
jgi:hypothetical protein